MFEGDIILTPAQRFAVDMGLDVDGGARGSSTYYRRWPNRVVPYTLDPTICKLLLRTVPTSVTAHTFCAS